MRGIDKKFHESRKLVSNVKGQSLFIQREQGGEELIECLRTDYQVGLRKIKNVLAINKNAEFK